MREWALNQDSWQGFDSTKAGQVEIQNCFGHCYLRNSFESVLAMSHLIRSRRWLIATTTCYFLFRSVVSTLSSSDVFCVSAVIAENCSKYKPLTSAHSKSLHSSYPVNSYSRKGGKKWTYKTHMKEKRENNTQLRSIEDFTIKPHI